MEFERIFTTAQFELTDRVKNSEKKSSVYGARSSDGAAKDSITKAIHESIKGTASMESNLDGMQLIDISGEGVARKNIREIFGKVGDPSMIIGCHPDFHHLSNSSDLENGYSITLFMDIAGSTKLGKKYPIETVFNIKNTIIKYAIEIIQAFDGHVHRIMGDAVMAFFRTKSHEENENLIMKNAVDSINCATYLIEFMEKIITPIIEEQGADEPIGIRIGVDYGAKEDVIWGNYGAFGAYEVTATSYNVDVAAKLQHAAKTNTVMIGFNLKTLLGLGHEYISVIEKSGRQQTYVRPNYKVGDSQINYKQYKFDHKKYFNILPQNLRGSKYRLKINETGTYYIGCSTTIEKHEKITFETSVNYFPGQELFLIAEKNNTGKDCGKERGISKKSYPMSEVGNGYYTASVAESTAYHGIHHMDFEIQDRHGNVIDKDKCVGVIVSPSILS
ncbi:adenylate/guanylate cyclase domain-containing protein [Cedecea sp. S5-13]|uniref:adenylate/guanylate cyclase domain-containing protein n=1 Tax=Cedecea selenatireducens TaxID=3144416 RepID=UPI0035CD325E